MDIDSIGIFRVSMPLVYPFRTACGDDYTTESVIVRLGSGDRYGWGESASGKEPSYLAECSVTQFVLSRDIIAPLILGRDIRSGAELSELLSGIKGNQFAKAAFDLAWWDLHARILGEPLWKVIGGVGPTVDAGADFGIMESFGLLLDTIREANEHGYRRIKLKCRPGWDLDMIDTVRGEFPDITIHVDCNSAYTLDDLDMFRRMDRYGLAMIEQPLAYDDLIDHAALQRHLSTPICLDESITSPDKARKAAGIGACRYINIKPGRVGGITNSLIVHDVCRDAGIPCWIGGMLESAVGASHCLALATLPNIRYPSDIFPTARFYELDIAAPPMVHSGPSQFTAHDAPGIGVEPDPAAIRKCTLDHVVIE
ncbi:o-succinylbenzoate synthase [bacterium]|nr:o-succinylbenzoate synthase [bacterium]